MTPLRIATVVEGHGEVSALPVLLRRIAAQLAPEVTLDLPRPHRIGRQNLVAPGGLEKAVTVALPHLGDVQPAPMAAVLILVDADDDCPALLGPQLLNRALAVGPAGAVATVLANREFEAWFLAGAASLSGKRGLADGLQAPPEPEKPRDCKGWLSAHRRDGHPYKPAADQAALAAVLDLDLARANAPSLDKLFREMGRLLGGPGDFPV